MNARLHYIRGEAEDHWTAIYDGNTVGYIERRGKMWIATTASVPAIQHETVTRGDGGVWLTKRWIKAQGAAS